MSTPPGAPSSAIPYEIPERLSSLFAPTRLQAIRQAGVRYASAASQASKASHASLESTASDFLEAKIEQLTQYKAYVDLVREGILDAHNQQPLPGNEFAQHIEPVLTRLSTANSTLRVLKRQRQALTDDLAEEVATRRQRLAEPSDQGLLERAYADTILSRVMSASKQSASPFNRKQFKKDVNDYYGITDNCPVKEMAWCHVIGDWIPAVKAKAAHIAPKSLHEAEVAHIFGDDDEVLSDPRNAVSLHDNIEGLLDQGIIVIVPSPGDFTTPTTWRCLVLDRSMDKNIVFYGCKDFIITIKDLHNRPLKFLNDNRPRRRYLYFRFIISYLNAKRRGMGNVTVPMETRKFWPSGGAYLHSSTLKVLARCVSGCELPADLTSTQTFEATSSHSRDVDAGTTLAAGIINPQVSTPSPEMRNILLETMRFTSPGNTLETSEDTALPSKVLSEISEEPAVLSPVESPL